MCASPCRRVGVADSFPEGQGTRGPGFRRCSPRSAWRCLGAWGLGWGLPMLDCSGGPPPQPSATPQPGVRAACPRGAVMDSAAQRGCRLSPPGRGLPTLIIYLIVSLGFWGSCRRRGNRGRGGEGRSGPTPGRRPHPWEELLVGGASGERSARGQLSVRARPSEPTQDTSDLWGPGRSGGQGGLWRARGGRGRVGKSEGGGLRCPELPNVSAEEGSLVSLEV